MGEPVVRRHHRGRSMVRAVAFAVLCVAGCRFYDRDFEECADAGRCADAFADAGRAGPLYFNPPEIVFAATAVDAGVTYGSVTFNAASTTVIERVEASPGFIVLDMGCRGAVISRTNSCSVNLLYAPTSKAHQTGTLHVESSQGPADIPLRGTPVVVSLELRPPIPSIRAAVNGTWYSRHTVVNTGETRIDRIGISWPSGSSTNILRADVYGCDQLPLETDGGPPAQSCVIHVSFNPTAAGVRTTTFHFDVTTRDLQLSQPYTLTAEAVPGRNLTVYNSGDGAGRVEHPWATNGEVSFGGGGAITRPVPDFTRVKLRADLVPGFSGFGGWGGVECADAGSPLDFDCDVYVDGGDLIVEAPFHIGNRLFVSSQTLPAASSLEAADALCRTEAAMIGPLIDAGSFIAWRSDGGAPGDRLGAARGFIRMPDGARVADLASDLSSGRHWSSVTPPAPDAGLFWSGGAGQDCGGWTGTGTAALGYLRGQGDDFTRFAVGDCADAGSRPVICVDTSRVARMLAPPLASDAQRLFITEGDHPFDADRDGICRAEAGDAGLNGNFDALSPRSPQGQADWWRVDGVLAGNATRLRTGELLEAVAVTARGGRRTRALAWFGLAPDGGTEDCGGWTDRSARTWLLPATAPGTALQPVTCDSRLASFICAERR